MNKQTEKMISKHNTDYVTGPVRLLFIISISIFLAEAFVMYVLSFLSPMPVYIETLVDSILLVLIVSPFLYFFLFMPLVKSVTEKEKSEESEKKKSTELGVLVAELNSYADSLRLDVTSARRILNFISGKKEDQIDFNENSKILISAISIPCSTEGGDHFFVRNLSGMNGDDRQSTVFSLKDQSGHSVPCLMRCIATDMIHHSLLDSNKESNFGDILKELNNTIIGSELFDDGEYFTSLDCNFNHNNMVLQYASGGHPPMFLIRGDEVTLVPQKGTNGHNLPMVLFDDIEITVGEIKLEIGDKLLLYTDGLYELLMDTEGGFGIEDLRKVVLKYSHLPASEIIIQIVSDIAGMSGETIDPYMEMNSTGDDITVIGIELSGKTERSAI